LVVVCRFRVKVNVSDATNVVVFAIFDGDMQNLLNTPCSTLVSVAKVYCVFFCVLLPVLVICTSHVVYLYEDCFPNLFSSPCIFKAENAGHCPSEFEKLKGKRMLFKVEKITGPSIFFDGSFRVKRVCDDPAIIQSFDTIGGLYTPSKVLFHYSFIYISHLFIFIFICLLY